MKFKVNRVAIGYKADKAPCEGATREVARHSIGINDAEWIGSKEWLEYTWHIEISTLEELLKLVENESDSEGIIISPPDQHTPHYRILIYDDYLYRGKSWVSF